jgi:glyoxylase-like metal-dependent hydrolase (beta-lactamase superfamily II)
MLLRTLCSFLLVFATLPAVQAQDASAPQVGFSIIRTASLHVREGLVYSGGSFSKTVVTNFSAILVKHGDSQFLFDSGLGLDIDSQYRQDMPLWQRAFFKYDAPVDPARTQLGRAGAAPIMKIILSHSHWDHASAIKDFPGAEIWVSALERGFIAQARSGGGAPWPSQVGMRDIAWRTLEFNGGPFEGFASSADLYGDARVVLVPLYGHTPGSIGMFVTVDSGQRYFFSGDATWSAAAIEQSRPKFWAARLFVDHDAQQTLQSVEQLHALKQRLPELTIVPAHDGAVQTRLGYFPQWVR